MPHVGVVLAHDDRAMLQALTEALEAAPDLFVASTSVTGAPSGGVVVAGGDALLRLRSEDRPVVAITTEDPLRAARAALALGAQDILRWPDEAERLPGAIRRAADRAGGEAGARGKAVAVMGARGGVGASTFAAALGAAFGDAVVLDLHPASAGQRAFAPDDPRTLSDLGPLDDVAAEVLDATLTAHCGGARALHARPLAAAPGASAVHGLLRAARALAPVVVADAGRGADPGARAAARAADARVVVVANDLASIRGVRALRARIDAPLSFVVRRRRDGVALRDLRAILDEEPLAVFRADRTTARAAELGRLPGRATPVVRAAMRVARRVREDGR